MYKSEEGIRQYVGTITMVATSEKKEDYAKKYLKKHVNKMSDSVREWLVTKELPSYHQNYVKFLQHQTGEKFINTSKGLYMTNLKTFHHNGPILEMEKLEDDKYKISTRFYSGDINLEDIIDGRL